jgi:hypothetical protein
MELTFGGGGRGGIIIVKVAGNVSWIMELAGGATEGVKGDVWVHRWQLVAAGKGGKGGGRWRGGGWPSPIKVDGGQRLLVAAADDKLWYRQGGG